MKDLVAEMKMLDIAHRMKRLVTHAGKHPRRSCQSSHFIHAAVELGQDLLILLAPLATTQH
jgi:hypothetical protein